MPARALSRYTIAVAALLALAGGSLALGQGGPRALTPAASPETPQRGTSGAWLSDEQDALGALRDHLVKAGVKTALADARLFPASQPDEIAICGLLLQRGGATVPLVARVLLARPSAAALAAAQASGRPPARPRAPLVVIEDGPGLTRGAGPSDAERRYCRDPLPEAAAPPAQRPVAQPVAAAAPAPPLAQEGGGPGGERIVVVTNVNVRTGPGGEILFTAPRGREFVVHGRAPGGWVQLGDGSTALGWAHSSLLAPPTP